jgi:hypothetical protein
MVGGVKIVVIDEVITITNKRMAEIDELILLNANSTLKLMDMQLQLLNDVEEQTDDKHLLKQLDQQVQQLKNNMTIFQLINKYIVSNSLTQHERMIFLRNFKESLANSTPV